MSQKTFSRRTVAIAVAASVTVGAVPVIGTSGPLAAITPTAHAQDVDQNAKPGIQATDAKYLGVFSKDGEKITGTLTFNNAQKGTPLPSAAGAVLRTSINLANAAPGDRINVRPQTTFSYPNGEEVTNSHAGLRIPNNSASQDLTYEGVKIGTWRYVQSGAMEIVFNDNIADITEGTLTMDVPAEVWSQWTNYKSFNVKEGEWDGRTLRAETQATPVIVVDATQKQSGKKTTNTLRTNQSVIFYVIAQNSVRDLFRHYEAGGVTTDAESMSVSARGDVIELPAGANGTVTAKPDTTRADSTDWTYATNLKFKPRFTEYGKRGADNEHTAVGESMSLEEAQAKYPGINASASIKNGTITATTTNVPENVKVTFRITPGEGETAIKYATYLENSVLRTEDKFQGTINGEDATLNSAIHALSHIARIPGVPSLDGVQTLDWSAALDGSIQDQPDGAGKNGNTAQIGGTKQTFQFFVKNNGNAYLAAPLVTLPDGKRVPVKGVGIKPGEEGSFSVDYNVPARAGVLNFEVSMGKADFKPTNKVSFRYANADQSTVAGNKINYPTNNGTKEAPRGQTTVVNPEGVPKGASAVRTPDTPAWAEIGSDGKLTLKPDNSAPLGRTEIPVKFTFPDGSEITVNPVITVAPHDPSKDGQPGTFDPRTDEERGNDEINKRLDQLEDATNKQTDKLNEIEESLNESNKLTQDQIDAINDQTKQLDKAIKDQSKAINDLKDVTEKNNKALIDALAEQSDAIDSALKSVEDTIREGDAAALEEAKKQTAQLDKNNQLIAEQNKELKNQTAQLKEQSDALKAQAATLEKVRANLDKANKLTEEQNKLIQDQIDAINAQTEAINNLIDATEKQTAEITARLDDANEIAGEQRDIMRKELAESVKQTAELKRQSVALERQNQILIDQHLDQLAQWEKENEFAQNEQDDRRHKDNFKRCVTSDPATAVLVALPALSLLAAVGIPYTGHMLEDANKQLTALNDRLGTQMNIPADLRNQINAFNAQNGDLVRTGATAVGAIAALAGLAVAINNLVNGCYAEADISVGREPQQPKTSSESVLSSKPWKQEADKKETEAPAPAEAENADAANAADAEVANQ